MRRFTARRQTPRPRRAVSPAPVVSPAPISISLNGDIYLEVARLSDRNDQISLCRVSKEVYLNSRFLLYQNIYVRGSAANALVDTLDKNTDLPPIVASLLFADEDAFVDIVQWERVIVQLKNLRFLGIAPLIPLRRSWIPRLCFRLSWFESLSTVSDEWLDLLRRQSSLEHLVFGDSFHGDIPTSNELPLLQTIYAPGPVIAQFAKHLRFRHIRFDYDRYLASWSLLPSEALDFSLSSSKITTIRISAPDLLKLITHGAQDVLSPLEHVVLEEDRSWTDHLYTNIPLLTTSLGKVVAMLDGSFPQLKSLVLVCASRRGPYVRRRLLSSQDGNHFANSLSAVCSAPALRTFRFFTTTSKDSWVNWGTAEEAKVRFDGFSYYQTWRGGVEDYGDEYKYVLNEVYEDLL
ncbi:hypothetical protein R3P38DRAFT_3175538 [Favolaschia claudopus]|uniref:Uncharacterized protein n=1 Tax=Favolaschia claudopus TaxID=2862362 RepID=A0AAW0D5W3_9AGAR